ncbi:glycosyltransferase [Mesorhizobium sp. AaZ16]|uniref:glycosyltransferase n=1 Tax=Mesorhizobium sp. AaZ16 TaxID=3402289 RepID=UPI00374EF818
MTLTVLNVAYPLAPVSQDAVGGAEQVLVALDKALVEAGHRSIVLACEGSSVAGTLFAAPAESGMLDEAAKQRAHARHRDAITAVRRRWPVDLVHLHGIDFDAYLPQDGPTLVTLHLPLDWYPPGALEPARDDLWMHAVSASQQARARPPAQGFAPRYRTASTSRRSLAATPGATSASCSAASARKRACIWRSTRRVWPNCR